MKWPARGSLLWRLSALGVVQLVLLAASVVFVGYSLHGVPGTGLPPESARSAERGPNRGEPSGPWGPLAIFFASGVLIVGSGAVLSWRWTARPLAELSAAARAVGAGKLEARARLSRSGELGELGRRFDEMAERIEGLVMTQEELLANVSHEVRTPLARIRVALDIASEGDALAARGSLEEIAIDLGELEKMIEDILTATRMELQSGARRGTEVPLRRRQLAPGSIVQQASERFRSRYPGRGLNVHVAEPLPEILVDATLFRRVIDNLLDNAYKYSPGESPITLDVVSDGGAVVFEVADRGMGISEQDLPRVFEPFFRVERSRSRGTGGVGLGLTLAKRIVEAHGGSIRLDSGSGNGTRARVSVESWQLALGG